MNYNKKYKKKYLKYKKKYLELKHGGGIVNFNIWLSQDFENDNKMTTYFEKLNDDDNDYSNIVNIFSIIRRTESKYKNYVVISDSHLSYATKSFEELLNFVNQNYDKSRIVIGATETKTKPMKLIFLKVGDTDDEISKATFVINKLVKDFLGINFDNIETTKGNDYIYDIDDNIKKAHDLYDKIKVSK